jgi:transcriptional regulator with XRE-family HTH domain
MKTPGQSGPFGLWLTEVRTQRYRTQREALAAMRRLAGLNIAPSEYAAWESGGRVPREDNPKVARLYEFFGSRPETPKEPGPPEEVAGLVSAIADGLAAQADLAQAIAAELRQLRSELADVRSAAEDQREEIADSLGRLEGAVARLHELSTIANGTALPGSSAQ